MPDPLDRLEKQSLLLLALVSLAALAAAALAAAALLWQAWA